MPFDFAAGAALRSVPLFAQPVGAVLELGQQPDMGDDHGVFHDEGAEVKARASAAAPRCQIE